MDLQKLERGLVAIEPGTPGEAEWREYFLEVAHRLEQVLGPWLSFEETVALIDIIHNQVLLFEDGFVINDDSDINKEMWIADAAFVAAAFCRAPDEDAAWWKREYWAHPKEGPAFTAVRSALLAKLRPHARIERC